MGIPIKRNISSILEQRLSEMTITHFLPLFLPISMYIITKFVGLAVATSFLATSLAAQQPHPPSSIISGGTQPGVSAGNVSNNGGKISQTLGPWDLVPPDSASLVSGGGSIFDWLNVVNSAVTLSQAMSSSPIENQGFANAETGTVVEVFFSGGVTNNAGADLVILDAAFDYGLYQVSSDFDGFAASVGVDILTSGVFAANSSYYYQGAGPYSATVWGVEIDLDSIGVPSGTTVNSLRFECTSGGCDPISLAKIDNGFSLEITNLVAGSVATATATNGTPNGVVGIAMSRFGNGPTLLNTGACGSMMVDLSPPISILTLSNADANGELSTSGQVPPTAAGLTLYFQALDIGSCTLSNAVTEVVQ